MRVWLALVCLVSLAAADDPLRYWLPANRQAQQELEARLVETVDAKRLRGYHDLLASRPHRAGSPGDLQVAASLAKAFADLGLEVEKQELWCYLATPVQGEVEIVAPDRIKLPVREKAIDAFSGHAEGSIGWNAFSGSGEAAAEVVYANYGRKEDFEKLDELGVALKGKIVIARYGGNFRGYKAKFAEARGAAGLLLYTDPIDSGYFKGLVYPEGGFANAHYIQRGSILTLPYRGDPLTPFEPATFQAERLDPAKVPFPKLPVQPIGWGAAWEILKRMKGAAVPEGWQGALPFAYRVTGGSALRVRVKVEQERQLTRTFNVVGTLKGARHPEQLVVVGAHHDAWGFGAGDPTSGTILVLEAARCFAEAARAGQRPARSIAFAAWAAEEYGIMGSTEWVEAHRDRLRDHAVGYLNLDMASMGPDPRASAAPSLKQVIAEVCRDEGHELKKLGNLGGGSDHMGFYCHMAIPAAGLGAGGSEGVSYHSLYDNLAWYRHVVGEDYASARMLARMVNRILARPAAARSGPVRRRPGHAPRGPARACGEAGVPGAGRPAARPLHRAGARGPRGTARRRGHGPGPPPRRGARVVLRGRPAGPALVPQPLRRIGRGLRVLRVDAAGPAPLCGARRHRRIPRDGIPLPDRPEVPDGTAREAKHSGFRIGTVHPPMRRNSFRVSEFGAPRCGSAAAPGRRLVAGQDERQGELGEHLQVGRLRGLGAQAAAEEVVDVLEQDRLHATRLVCLGIHQRVLVAGQDQDGYGRRRRQVDVGVEPVLLRLDAAAEQEVAHRGAIGRRARGQRDERGARDRLAGVDGVHGRACPVAVAQREDRSPVEEVDRAGEVRDGKRGLLRELPGRRADAAEVVAERAQAARRRRAPERLDHGVEHVAAGEGVGVAHDARRTVALEQLALQREIGMAAGRERDLHAGGRSTCARMSSTSAWSVDSGAEGARCATCIASTSSASAA
jgi:N-acetylated-alpha-linked acidic dipeptidase